MGREHAKPRGNGRYRDRQSGTGLPRPAQAFRSKLNIVPSQKIHHRAVFRLIFLHILQRNRQPRLALLPDGRGNPSPLDFPREFLLRARVVVVELEIARRLKFR